MKSTCLLRSVTASILACASSAHAQMTWLSYDTSGNQVSANAAAFDPATGTYSLTIPASSNRVFVTTDFVPITITQPGSGRPLTPLTFSMEADGGYGTGGSVQNKFTAFGLFSTNGTAPGATGNFTDDTGIWLMLYQQSNGSFNTKPASIRSGALTCPAKLLSTDQATYGLGTARGGTGGVIEDNQVVDVAFTTVLNSSGSWQLGNTTNSAPTATNATGVLFTDNATGGTVLQRTVYSDTSSGLSGTQTFDEFGFLFENGTASPVTLQLSALSLPGPPYLIVEPPSSPSVSLGGSLTISTTSGGAPDSHQWEFSDNGGSSYSEIVGATAPDYTITVAEAGDAGLYRVVVTNAAGSATSTTADVSVTNDAVAPSIQTQPAGDTILVGESITFNVLANGSPPLTYQWEISTNGGSTFSEITDPTDDSFTIDPAGLSDDASYRVVVTNSAGTATSDPAVLMVHEVPAITTSPTGTVMPTDSEYTLSVAATGTPDPSYQWHLNGVDVSGAINASLPLTLSAAVSGAYSVTVTNDAGSLTSDRVYVGVPSSMTPTYFPAAGATSVNPDTPPGISFPSPPVVGTAGQVRVYNADGDILVETIDLNTLTRKTSADSRLVPQREYWVANGTVGGLDFNYFPIIVNGNTAQIHLQTTLDYNSSYYIEIDPGVILDSTGATLPALNGPTAWSYATKAAAPAADTASLTVAADGSGDFTTVQGAIDFIPFSPANTIPRTITVQDGVYTELIHVRTGKNMVTIQGESRDGAIIEYLNNGDIFANVTLYSRGVFVTQANDFTLENITVRNLTPRFGSQAESFITNWGIQRCTVSRANILSLQDTALTGGEVFFTDCYIEGDVDFMWGVGGSFFQNCEIRSMNPGYLTQIRNDETTVGNVYLNCRLTRVPGLGSSSVVLARIDPTGAYAHSQCVYIDCAMDSHIKSTGWQLDGASAAPDVRFWEYQSVNLSGAPINVSSRPTYNKIPTGVGASTVLNNQQIDSPTADFFRMPGNVAGFMPAVAPVIDLSPTGASLDPGGNHTLAVEATLGYPAASYQWHQGETPVVGATEASHTISNADSADAGDYTVVLTNSAGTATSAVATVNISNPTTPIEDYVISYGLDPETDGAPDANPSGDGISNLMKFVLGGNPTISQTDILPIFEYDDPGTNPVLVFSYDRDISATASMMSVDIVVSETLTTWDPVEHGVDGVVITITPIDANNEHVEARIPTGTPLSFARLNVTPLPGDP